VLQQPVAHLHGLVMRRCGVVAAAQLLVDRRPLAPQLAELAQQPGQLRADGGSASFATTASMGTPRAAWAENSRMGPSRPRNGIDRRDYALKLDRRLGQYECGAKKRRVLSHDYFLFTSNRTEKRG